MVEVFAVQADLGGPEDFVVVALGVGLGGEEFFLVAEGEGGRASDSRTEFENPAVVALEAVGVARYIGSRPDETHVAPEHAPELGKLVEFGTAEEGPETGDAGITGRGHRGAVGGGSHRAQLDNRNETAAPPDSFLDEESAGARGASGEEGKCEEGEAEREQAQRGGGEIKGALAKVLGGSHGQWRAGGGAERFEGVFARRTDAESRVGVGTGAGKPGGVRKGSLPAR